MDKLIGPLYIATKFSSRSDYFCRSDKNNSFIYRRSQLWSTQFIRIHILT